jgi:hypothetical protein
MSSALEQRRERLARVVLLCPISLAFLNVTFVAVQCHRILLGCNEYGRPARKPTHVIGWVRDFLASTTIQYLGNRRSSSGTVGGCRYAVPGNANSRGSESGRTHKRVAIPMASPWSSNGASTMSGTRQRASTRTSSSLNWIE